MSKSAWARILDNEPVSVKPSTAGLGLILGGFVVYAAYEYGRSSAVPQTAAPQAPPQAAAMPEREQMGSVHRRMGGRGPEAGSGTAPWLGGRNPHQPYEYSAPSAMQTNWQKFG